MKTLFFAIPLFFGLISGGLTQIKPDFLQDAPGAKDHPFLKRMEGSIILRASGKKFDAHPIPLERIVFDYSTQQIKEWKKIVAEGARTTLFYRQPKDATTLECIRSYQEDLKGKGFEVFYEGSSGGKPTGDTNTLDNGYGRFIAQVYQTETDYSLQQYTLAGAEDFRYTALKRADPNSAGIAYVTIFAAAVPDSWKDPEKGIVAGTILARVDVLETKAMENRMVLVKAADMEKQLNASGRVALQGIYFDFNQATVKPESDPALQEVQKLMQSDSSLKLLVVGHTDNVGTFEFNRDLSQRRAAAVAEALCQRFGLSAERIFPFGCSFAAPAAPNGTEEGRAKNRRVELVRWN